MSAAPAYNTCYSSLSRWTSLLGSTMFGEWTKDRLFSFHTTSVFTLQQHATHLGLTRGMWFVAAFFLSSSELCHDCFVCSHDLERFRMVVSGSESPIVVVLRYSTVSDGIDILKLQSSVFNIFLHFFPRQWKHGTGVQTWRSFVLDELQRRPYSSWRDRCV